MIDIHCHVLAGIDDGAKDLNESLMLIKKLTDQGVNFLALTPHFYARSENSIEHFIQRRDKAYKELLENYQGNMRFLLGAEVHYYRGISQTRDLNELCLQGTDLLLLEMPFREISDSIIEEIKNLTQRYTIVLAHINRYTGLLADYQLKTLLNCGVLLQVNNEVFNSFFINKEVNSLINNKQISFLASDCHNMTSRIPDHDIARNKIIKKYSQAVYDEIIEKSMNIIISHRI